MSVLIKDLSSSWYAQLLARNMRDHTDMVFEKRKILAERATRRRLYQL